MFNNNPRFSIMNNLCELLIYTRLNFEIQAKLFWRIFSNSGSGTTGGGCITLQDIVRNDPGYTSNIEHLVFPERKSSNPNLTSQSSSGGQQTNKSKPGISVLSLVNTSLGNPSARSRLTEVFGRHYARGSSLQDVGVTTRSNHHNVSAYVHPTKYNSAIFTTGANLFSAPLTLLSFPLIDPSTLTHNVDSIYQNILNELFRFSWIACRTLQPIDVFAWRNVR